MERKQEEREAEMMFAEDLISTTEKIMIGWREAVEEGNAVCMERPAGGEKPEAGEEQGWGNEWWEGGGEC